MPYRNDSDQPATSKYVPECWRFVPSPWLNLARHLCVTPGTNIPCRSVCRHSRRRPQHVFRSVRVLTGWQTRWQNSFVHKNAIRCGRWAISIRRRHWTGLRNTFLRRPQMRGATSRRHHDLTGPGWKTGCRVDGRSAWLPSTRWPPSFAPEVHCCAPMGLVSMIHPHPTGSGRCCRRMRHAIRFRVCGSVSQS